jgi:hypothetical protein
MASVLNTQQVQWAAADSKTVAANTIQWSDAITLNVEDWDGSLQVSADNAGTAAAGDTCDVYIGWSNGDVLGDTGNDFDTDEHAEFVGRLDTYATNSPGEDPARKTWDINVSGKVALRIGVICPQAATRNIAVRARLTTHRPA